jgi:hypothetical protein
MKCTNGNCHNEARRGHSLCSSCAKEAERMDLPAAMYLVTDAAPKPAVDKAKAKNEHQPRGGR